MNFFLSQVLTYSILIPFTIGLVRYKVVDKAYLPFIFLTWVGVGNEIFSTLLIKNGISNAINSNIYVLTEFFFLLWLFKSWKVFGRHSGFFAVLVVAGVFVWIFECLILFSLRTFCSYFRIFYSFIIVMLSISKINMLLVERDSFVNTKGIFFLLTGFIIYFSYKALVEIFWVYGLNASRVFRLEVYRIMNYVNFSVNIIYAIALLWIPRKQESILRSS